MSKSKIPPAGIPFTGRSLFTLALLALVLPSGVARAQGGLPGSLLTWERVGDRPIKSWSLAFDGARALYASDGARIYRLGLPGGFPGVWEFISDEIIIDAMIGLGPDTLVATAVNTERSTDGGYTWERVHDKGGDEFNLHEAAADTPLAGDLFVGSVPPAASEDRGATWEERGLIPDFGSWADVFVALPSGRLVAGAHWGAAYSDDAGWTWTTSSLWAFGQILCDLITRVKAPDGGERVLVRCQDQTLPHVRVWYSDDEGETWLPEDGIPLPQADNGIGRGWPAGLWALGGARALAVLGRGFVYATEDGGETWAVVGEVPDVDDHHSVYTSTLGPDGRLYVGLTRTGPSLGNAWVYRTRQRVTLPVAAEPGPEPQAGLGLEVQPNPVWETATVVVTLAQPAEVEAVVYDVLGRRMAVVHSGALGAGAHALPVGTVALPSGVYVIHVTARVGGVPRAVTHRFTVVR